MTELLMQFQGWIASICCLSRILISFSPKSNNHLLSAWKHLGPCEIEYPIVIVSIKDLGNGLYASKQTNKRQVNTFNRFLTSIFESEAWTKQYETKLINLSENLRRITYRKWLGIQLNLGIGMISLIYENKGWGFLPDQLCDFWSFLCRDSNANRFSLNWDTVFFR